jgi:hypothetical protein
MCRTSDDWRRLVSHTALPNGTVEWGWRGHFRVERNFTKSLRWSRLAGVDQDEMGVDEGGAVNPARRIINHRNFREIIFAKLTVVKSGADAATLRDDSARGKRAGSGWGKKSSTACHDGAENFLFCALIVWRGEAE